MNAATKIIAGVFIATLTACSSGDGRGMADKLAGRQTVPTGAPTVQPTAEPTSEPQRLTKPMPTETPDFAPIATAWPTLPPATPAPIVTPQPVQIGIPIPTCDPRTPAPTIALDQSDIDAGVVVRGVWPCWDAVAP